MFTSLCDNDTTKSLLLYITHPLDIRKKIFVLFDFVYLMKCIRNNWLNLRYQTKTFNYPDINNNNKVKNASIKDIRDFYLIEKNEILKRASLLCMH